ncbi:MAG TPA: hypothetical protein PKM73_20050 [Verrucomicrobiota bacterium]|nr:hypothetical protein [Verrucomicrobiota bacterium]HNU50589.1 hypothetical protein [Verrucomicrobiota bacterium]
MNFTPSGCSGLLLLPGFVTDRDKGDAGTGGVQWHILSYLGHDRLGNSLGAGWGQPGVRFSKADLTEYSAEVNISPSSASMAE